MKVPSFSSSSSFPLSLLFFFSLQTSITLCSSSSNSSVSFQLIALLSLKSSLKDPLSSFHDWASPNSHPNGGVSGWCSWSGVKCQPDTSQVVSLDLSRRNLSGQIPPQIRHLSSLIHLNLSGNAFHGPLQPAIFELENPLNLSRTSAHTWALRRRKEAVELHQRSRWAAPKLRTPFLIASAALA